MKWDLDIKNFLKKYNYTKHCTNTQLVKAYYRTNGINDETSVKDWIFGLGKLDYPSWTTAYKLIKKYR